MKKSILSLEGVSVLTKTQQKNTLGGLADGGFGGSEEGEGGTCAGLILNGDGERLVFWGTKSEVLAVNPNNWCCSSCSTASWINSCNIC